MKMMRLYMSALFIVLLLTFSGTVFAALPESRYPVYDYNNVTFYNTFVKASVQNRCNYKISEIVIDESNKITYFDIFYNNNQARVCLMMNKQNAVDSVLLYYRGVNNNQATFLVDVMKMVQEVLLMNLEEFEKMLDGWEQTRCYFTDKKGQYKMKQWAFVWCQKANRKIGCDAEYYRKDGVENWSLVYANAYYIK